MESPASKVRKRVREACEPCRRKKNRCPGEKPVCSYCARLGQSQNCTYAGNTRASSVPDGNAGASTTAVIEHADQGSDVEPNLEERVVDLDSKVSRVLDQVRLLASVRSHSDNDVPDESTPELLLPSPQLLHRSAELFLRYCHCQPLPLFSPGSFVATFAARDSEVRLCVAGISLRFDPDSRPRLGQEAPYNKYLHSARALVMRRVTQGPVDLSTLQCLCLLALSDFNTGKHQQSGIYLSLASELARSSKLDWFARNGSNHSRFEEHVRCLWSIVLLQHLAGGFGPMSVAIDTTGMRYPTIDATNHVALTARQSSGVTQDTDDDLGIVVYGLQMTETWHRVRRYVQQRGKIDEYPPWSGQSIYSSIMFRQMEIESQMPHRHRFKPSRFADQGIADISANRLYWAPWLYLQIIYHAVVCALNHPILLSIHLRRFRVNQVPELFLQHTADLITTHTDWIIHLLELAREKQFEFGDPFLGQCVAIVATIFLQQSYTQDQEVRKEKHEKFLICLYVVQDLGRRWAYVDQMVSLRPNVDYLSSIVYHLTSISGHRPPEVREHHVQSVRIVVDGKFT